MSKKLNLVALAAFICFICIAPANAETINWDLEPKNYHVKVYVDTADNELTFSSGMGKPFIAKDRTFAPYRVIADALGASVDWEDNTRKVIAEGNNSKVELFIGNKDYKANGTLKTMDVEPFILTTEGRTYIPARYLIEGLNYNVDFINDGRILHIVTFTKGQNEIERKEILSEIVETFA